MNAGDIVARAAWILNDVDHTRWEESMLLSFLGEAQSQTALLRPDATARDRVVALRAGTNQALPEDGLRLLKVRRDMGVDGATPGRAVQRSDEDTLDACLPDWRSNTEGGPVRLWVHDARQPRCFQIWPGQPSDNARQVEIAYSTAPGLPGTMNDILDVDACFAGPLLDFMLHRAFAVDGGSASGRERSALHLEAFTRALNGKLSGDMLLAGSTGSAGIPARSES